MTLINNSESGASVRSKLNDLIISEARKLKDVTTLLADTNLTYTAGQDGTVVAGDIVRTRAEGFSYEVAASGATDQHVTTAGGVKLYVLPGDSGYNVKAFGAVGDGSADDTAAIQAAIDIGKPLVLPFADYLVSDTLTIDETKGIEIQGEMRTAANTTSFPRISFEPSSKVDVFAWKNAPATYAFGAVVIKGVAINGDSTGAASVFNLPGLYRGNLDAYAFSGFDYFATVERWLDCNVTGNVNGFRVAAFRFVNSTLSTNNITTRTNFDVYVSGGAEGVTTYGYDVETYSLRAAKISGIVESVDCAIRMAVGNSIDSQIYTENVPRTNAGSLLQIGKADTGALDKTTVFTHHGVNLHGRNTAAADYSATIFADIDVCSTFIVDSTDIKRFGGLLKTTANSKNVNFTNTYAIGVTLLELTTSDIADFAQVNFSSFRTVGMASPHGGSGFQDTKYRTTTALNPLGVVRPRWGYDQLYSSSSESFWQAVTDDPADWRLMAPRVYVGTATLTPGTIAAGASYQQSVTVTGALQSDFAVASYGGNYPGIVVSARVNGADTVTVTLTNVTGGSIAAINATARVMVTKCIT